MSGGDADPTATPRLLIVLTKFSLHKRVQVWRQGASATPAGDVPRALGRLAPEVRMNLSRDLYAQLVLVTLPALGFDADAVRAARVIWLRHPPHRFLVP